MPRREINSDAQSMRGYLSMLDREYPDEIVRIKQPVDMHFSTTSVVFELERAGKSPVVVFEQVGNAGMPIVTNIAASRKLLAACLGVPTTDLATAFRERCQKYISVRSGEGSSLGRNCAGGRRRRPDEAADPAAVLGRCGALYHCRTDHGTQPNNRRGYDRISSPDAERQKPAWRLAALTPAPL